METSPQQTRFKIVRLTAIDDGLKQTISTNSGSRMLHRNVNVDIGISI